ncbi:unnamed protein product [Musa acuminata var. zebrina]
MIRSDQWLIEKKQNTYMIEAVGSGFNSQDGCCHLRFCSCSANSELSLISSPSFDAMKLYLFLDI